MTEEETDEEYMKRENAILKKWIIRNFGTKCPEFVPSCGLCQAWKAYKQLAMEG